MPRLFFSLWPEPAVREQLAVRGAALAALAQGRAMRPHNLHMTLVFVGDVTDDRAAALLDCGAHIARDWHGEGRRGFTLGVDRAACFRRARIAWLGCGAAEPLHLLQQKVLAAVMHLGAVVDAAEFRPHVTVARKIAAPYPDQPVEPAVEWLVTSFVLVESKVDDTGSDYRVVGEWALE